MASPAPLPLYDSARRPHPFVEEWLDVWGYRHLILQWSLRNLKIRYKRSLLGVLWTLLEPLLIMLILTIVFSTVFRFEVPHYPVYVLIGLTTWDFFRRSTVSMMDETIHSQSLARRIYLPRSAFAIAWIITYMLNWLLSLVPLLAIMLWLDHPIRAALLTLPGAMLITAFFALGIGLVVSTVSAFFHDFGLMYQVLLTAWMYATPIIYPLEVLPEQYRAIIEANPMTHLVALVREPVYDARMPDPLWWTGALGLSLVVLAVGWWVFSRSRDAIDYRV